ncbi:hypothetical protein ACFL2A_02945 [Thermodesulfobacteriota bacterium]
MLVEDKDETSKKEDDEKFRGCYCGALDDDFLKKEGIPQGYCGICERCSKPGHTRHYPGPVPYTGSWCDRCYKIEGVFYVLKMFLFLGIAGYAIGMIIAAIVKFIF